MIAHYMFIYAYTSTYFNYVRDSPCILFTSIQEHSMAVPLPINYLTVGIPTHFLKVHSDMFYLIGLFDVPSHRTT